MNAEKLTKVTACQLPYTQIANLKQKFAAKNGKRTQIFAARKTGISAGAGAQVRGQTMQKNAAR